MVLLERQQELASLATWMNAAVGGSGAMVLLGGEAGIGKTTLLQAFVDTLARPVLWGSCDALFTPQPLAPLYDMARHSSGSLTAALEAGRGREAIFAACLDELERPGSLLVFEDMHWADEASLDLLKYLGRRVHRTHSMIVVTYRHDEVGALHPLRLVIGDLPRAGTRRLILAPLSEEAVDALASKAGRSAHGIHAVTGGNPLFVDEVLSSDSDAVPASVRDSVLARAARLPSLSRQVAESIAVIPGRVEPWLIDATVHPDAAALDDCQAIGLVRHADGSLAFRHELVRRALEDALAPGRKRALHASVLAVLEERRGIQAARLVHHANGAGDGAKVLILAPLAAAQAIAVGAHREAATHFQSALRHAGALDAEARAVLLEGSAYECYLTDQMERAIADRVAALAIWRDSGNRLKEGDTLRWLSRLSWFAGRRAPANQYADEAVAVLESLPRGAELAMAYSNRAQLDMLAHQADTAIQWAESAIALAEAADDAEILAHALNNRGTAKLLRNDESGWLDLDASCRMSLAAGLQEHVARAYTNISTTAVMRRDYARARAAFANGIAYCTEHDLDSWRLYMLAWRARAKFEQGNWDGAAEDADEVLRHPRTAPVSRVPALIALAHLRIRRGDPDAASPLAQARSLAGPIDELQRTAPLALAAAEAAWLTGDDAAASRALLPVHEMALQRRDTWLTGELSVMLWRIHALPSPAGNMAPPHAAEISGDWRAAATAWRQLGCPYEEALVLGWYGQDAEQRIALDTFARLGALPASEALLRHLRSRGVRGLPRGSRASTLEHPLGLTKREAQILGLMREGLRNAAIAKKLFLSTRTVDHHVSAILTKLGVDSRAAAIRIGDDAAKS